MKVSFRLLFNVQPTGRPGGWSESWIDDVGTFDNESLTRLVNLYLRHRLNFAGSTCGCVGARVRRLDVPTARPVLYKFQPPRQNFNQPLGDAGFMTLETIGSSASGKKRAFRFACMPDSQVINGTWQPSGTSRTAYAALMKFLVTDVSYIAGQDPAAVQSPILSVSTTGAVKLSQPIALAVGDFVRLKRVRESNGVSRAGIFAVATVVDSFNFTVLGWKGLTDIQYSGQAQKYSIIYEPVASSTDPEIVSRKMGRPFFLPRARKFKRKAR